MSIDDVTEAYSARAAEYTDVVGRIEHASQRDRSYLLAWARGVEGRLLDVGCGPGQWTNLFHHEGIDVEGIDPVEAFVEGARTRYPEARYRTGRAEDLGVPAARVGGILAWFSLIHTDPDHIDDAFAELARCLRPGGSLALGFFVGPDGQPFDHAVTTAYHWSVDGLGQRVERAGFTVVDALTRTEPGARDHGIIVAERSAQAGPHRART